MNIIQATSRDYFSQKFNSAMFYSEDGTPCVLPSPTQAGLNNYSLFDREGNVRAIALLGTPEKPTKKELLLSRDFFDSMEKFNVPELGWRTAADGRVLFYFERRPRSYKKGICLDNVDVTSASHTTELMRTGNLSEEYYSRPITKAFMLLSPNFIPLHEGLEAMNNGKIMSFAVSSRIAITPSAEEYYNIVFDKKVVGQLYPDGRTVMLIKSQLEELL